MEKELNPRTQSSPGSHPSRVLRDDGIGDLFYWLQALTTALICLVLVFTFFGRLTRVVGDSMDNTLRDGELLLVWSLGYQPQAGDIVILNKNTEETSSVLHGDAIVKRVIATGGQTVDIAYNSSRVYVDGQPIQEPYIKEEMYLMGSSMGQTHFEIPTGSVFVMGDNRNNSPDSRHDLVGPIDEGYLLGKAVFSVWPLSTFGLL